MVRAETGREGMRKRAEVAKAGSAGLAHGVGHRCGSDSRLRKRVQVREREEEVTRVLRDSPLGKEKREEEKGREQGAMLRGAHGPPGVRSGGGPCRVRLRAQARALVGLGPQG